MVEPTAERDARRPARDSSVSPSRRLRAAALPVEMSVHGACSTRCTRARASRGLEPTETEDRRVPLREAVAAERLASGENESRQ